MTGRSRTTAIVVATALLITGAAFAQGMGGTGRGSGGRPGGMMPGGGGMNESFGPGNINAFRMLAGRLDLTDFQKEELETILTDAREDMEELREAAACQVASRTNSPPPPQKEREGLPQPSLSPSCSLPSH